jgi:phosphate starvation-inducible PhoH-like protein|tara:strand:- start:4393 stop:5292 length:900 start_codon:yes stop_codon:yes gene_type:complete
LKLRSPAEAISLFGQNDQILKVLKNRLNASVVARGDEVKLTGDNEDVKQAALTFQNLLSTIRGGGELSITEIEHADLDNLVAQADEDPHLPKRAQPKTSGQRRYVRAIHRGSITFGIGPAGTGKTFLAVAMAVQALTERRVKRLVLTRPAVEAGERLGFLPGDLQAKIDPYLRPLYDALYDMLHADKMDQLMDQGAIEIAPLAFMRGRTLNDAFIILDEAQNTTQEQMKMFLTRMGFNSKVVVTGDVTQTDLPGNVQSGLTDAENILKGIDGIEFLYFSEQDVVRHALVASIIKAYEAT